MKHTGDLHVALRAVISLQPLRCFKTRKFNRGVDLNVRPYRSHSILHAFSDYSRPAFVEVLQIGAEARFRELGYLHRLREISALADQFFQAAGECKEVPPFDQVATSVKDEALVKVNVRMTEPRGKRKSHCGKLKGPDLSVGLTREASGYLFRQSTTGLGARSYLQWE